MIHQHEMSCVTRKPVFCICENKGPDQLRGNCAADQRLFYRYIDSTIPLLPKSTHLSLHYIINQQTLTILLPFLNIPNC